MKAADFNRTCIGGDWIGEENPSRLEVHDPSSGARIASLPDCGVEETRDAIHLAKDTMQSWRDLPAKARAAVLKSWHRAIQDRHEDLARLISQEQGKPLRDARYEVDYGASFVEWFAEEAKRIYGDIMPSPWPGKSILVTREPVGVVAAITPWNFPMAMVTRKVAPALAAGCSVVVKPAEATPLTALALATLAYEAGLPRGLLSIITTSRPAEVGHELATNPDVRKISFTGSTRVGKLLMEKCAGNIKRVSLELGGNAPLIVFDDANLDAAVDGVANVKFFNSGQSCICPNRIFVQDAIYQTFLERLTEKVRAITVAPGTSESSQLGPLINDNAVRKVEDHIADAVEKGSLVACGGKRHELGGNFFQPTVLAGVTTQMRISKEETFGPVAPLIRFSSEAEVIDWANAGESGLAAYVYTRSLGRAHRMSAALAFGMVGVNESRIANEIAPFGGIKESGLGREGSKYGLNEFLEMKYTLLGGLNE